MSEVPVRDRYILIPFLVHPKEGGPFITIAWNMEQAVANAKSYLTPAPREVRQISYPLRFADKEMHALHGCLKQDAVNTRDLESRVEARIMVRRMAKLHGVPLADE